jgi:DNA-binding MarR family transcriptional regulator
VPPQGADRRSERFRPTCLRQRARGSQPGGLVEPEQVVDLVNDLGYGPGMNEPGNKDSGGLPHRGDETHLVREVLRTYQALMAGISCETGMPASRFALMRLLAVTDADLGVMDLARQLGINAAAVTRQVKDLERERLVRRHAEPRDARRSYVRLSPKGRRLFAKIHERTHAFERALASVIGTDESAVATAVLAKLRACLARRCRGRGRVSP